MSNRRAPLIAAVAVGAVVLLTIVLLVLPKRAEVGSARDKLTTTQQQTQTLKSQVAVLLEAQAKAPAARDTLRKVARELPPTVDEAGILLLLRNAAARSGVSLQYAISAPTAATGYSIVPVSLTVEGTYFSLAEFLYKIETLPRAAKVLSASMSASSSSTSTSTSPAPIGTQLSISLSLELYTSDVSAGPGSEPGPTAGSSGAGS